MKEDSISFQKNLSKSVMVNQVKRLLNLVNKRKQTNYLVMSLVHYVTQNRQKVERLTQIMLKEKHVSQVCVVELLFHHLMKKMQNLLKSVLDLQTESTTIRQLKPPTLKLGTSLALKVPRSLALDSPLSE